MAGEPAMLAPARTILCRLPFPTPADRKNSGDRREWCSMPLTAESGDAPYAGLPNRGPYGEAVEAAAAACPWAPLLATLLLV